MGRGPSLAPLLAAAALVLGGCLSTPASAGSIRGELVAVGGPPSTPSQTFTKGEIRFETPSGKSYSARVGEDGRYSIELPPGTYTISGQSPEYLQGDRWLCSSRSVRLTRGGSAVRYVVCPEP